MATILSIEYDPLLTEEGVYDTYWVHIEHDEERILSLLFDIPALVRLHDRLCYELARHLPAPEPESESAEEHYYRLLQQSEALDEEDEF